MRNVEDIETYLIDAGYPFERLKSSGMWRISDDADNVDNIIAVITGNVLTCQVKLFELPAQVPANLFRRMLEMNATDMVHGSFAISGDDVLLIDSLELGNLDRNELQATIEGLAMGVELAHGELSPMLNA